MFSFRGLLIRKRHFLLSLLEFITNKLNYCLRGRRPNKNRCKFPSLDPVVLLLEHLTFPSYNKHHSSLFSFHSHCIWKMKGKCADKRRSSFRPNNLLNENRWSTKRWKRWERCSWCCVFLIKKHRDFAGP